jgi:hypothetical protein
MPGSQPRWSFVSVAAPIVGFIGGLVLCMEGWWIPGIRDFRDALFWGLSVWAGFSAFGLVAAGIAWARAERFWMVRAAGFVLSAILPVAFLWSGALTLLNWLRYG